MLICFLLSSEDKIEEIKIDTKNEIYPSGEKVKDGKTLNIYYIEALFSNSNIKIDVSKKSFFLKLESIQLNVSKTFLFNKDLFDKDNKKIGKLNCFDINEEFDIYYQFHSKEKNLKQLNSLISSTKNIIKNDEENSNFSFLVNIIMKDSFNLLNNKISEDILLNIKKKGDLTKIPKEKLYDIYNNRKNEKILQIIIVIYMILSEQDIEEIVKFLETNKIRVVELISYFDKFENLFLNSINLFPKYTFLFDYADSFNKIKTIFKCSKNLTDFIYSLNAKKETITSFLDNEEKEEEDKGKMAKENMKDKVKFFPEKEKKEKKEEKEEKEEKKQNDKFKNPMKANTNINKIHCKMEKEIKKLILNDFFDLEKAFDPEFDENFYLILNNIKEFETKINKKILKWAFFISRNLQSQSKNN